MSDKPRILHVTSMWPSTEHPHSGTFVFDLVCALKDKEGTHDVVHIRADESKLNYLRDISKISELVKSGDYDLIHAQYAHCAIVSKYASGTLPVLAHFHGEFGYGYWKQRHFTYKSVLDRLKCYRDGVLARYIAPKVAGVAVVKNSDLEKVNNPLKELIPIGVNLATFTYLERSAAREQLELDQTANIILFPGNPARPDKNYFLFAAVIKALKEMGHNIEVMILHGINHTRVSLYMNAADVMLLTSYSEASPTVVKEANLCNLPVVSVPVGDVSSQLSGVSPGGVFEPDKDILAGIVSEIISSRIRSNGRSVSERIWDIRDTADKVLRFYNTLLRTK